MGSRIMKNATIGGIFGPRCRLLLTLCLTAAAQDAAHGQGQAPAPLRLDVTRDAWVSDVGPEGDGNNGGAARLKLKSIQEMSLVDIDASPLVGRTIRSAVLHLKTVGDERLERVTVSSVGAEWFEGNGSGYAVQPGGATFRHRRHPDLPWSIGGGDLCNVILGNGGTFWRMADASPPDPEGWQHIPVDPGVVAARVAGISHGFLLFDDTGTEWTKAGEKFTLRTFPNRFVYSREQNRSSAPYFTIELGPDDRQPPAAPSDLRSEGATALLPPGEALVTFVTPRDDGPAGVLGFFAKLDDRALPRELIPLVGKPGERVEMPLRDLKLAAGKTVKLSIQAVDGAGNVGPAVTAEITVSSHVPAPLPQPKPPTDLVLNPAVTARPRIAGMQVAIIDELDKVHPTTGELIPPQSQGYLAANHLWNAQSRTISLHAARNEFVAFQVLLGGANGTELIKPELRFEGQANEMIPVELGRYYRIPSKLGLIADPIVPLNFPARATAPATSQSLHVEIYVPHTVSAGLHRGLLTLSGATANESLRLPVELFVWDFTLPDHLSFLPEMNCYGLPENERDYYRLAHRHRTVLNRVPYNQNGLMAPGCAPVWDSKRQDFNWSAWDRRFGPLLDGSAFADLPRKSVPVECFYLPLHENWPSLMEGNYNGDYWADRAFPASYRRAFVIAARQIAAHAQARRWTETLFQGFLNNKVDFKKRGWSTASSAAGCWTSRPTSRTSGPFVTSPRLFTRGSTRLPSAAARRPPPRPGSSFAPTSPGPNGSVIRSTACSTTMSSPARFGSIRGWSWIESGSGVRLLSSMARPTRSKARTSSRSRGAWMSGRSVPMASFPGKRWGPPRRGIKPTTCRSSIRPAARDRVRARFHRSASRRIVAASKTSST